MAFKLGMTGDMLILDLDYLDLGAMSQWLGRRTKSALKYLDNKASSEHARLNSFT